MYVYRTTGLTTAHTIRSQEELGTLHYNHTNQPCRGGSRKEEWEVLKRLHTSACTCKGKESLLEELLFIKLKKKMSLDEFRKLGGARAS